MRLFFGVTLAATLAAGTALARLSPDAPSRPTVTPPTVVSAYGAAPQQTGELRLPPGPGPFPVVVVIHGGCWTKGYAVMKDTAAAASAFTAKGVATWNIEYRQIGEPGAGWPGTFQDWGAATDHLRVLAKTYPLDLARVVVVGHSAGAHAALFVASRPKLPAGSPVRGADPMKVAGVVAVDGPFDLRPLVGPDAEVCGRPVIAPLMGGVPAEQPERYAQASPVTSVPLGVRTGLVSTAVLAPEWAEVYRAAAAKGGDRVDVIVRSGSGHFEPFTPGTSEWADMEAMVLRLAGVKAR